MEPERINQPPVCPDRQPASIVLLWVAQLMVLDLQPINQRISHHCQHQALTVVPANDAVALLGLVQHAVEVVLQPIDVALDDLPDGLVLGLLKLE
mgnify:CR=1 FL=1